MEIIKVIKHNEVYLAIQSELGVLHEIADKFTFKVPNFWFTPAYKNGIWDGRIRLLNLKTRQLYAGLLPYLQEFCDEREYQLEVPNDYLPDEFSVIEAEDFIRKLNLKLIPRDYQLDAFIYGIRHRRVLFLSATGSGKSFIIFLLTWYYNMKTLIIVPTTNLVEQMSKDFIDYYGCVIPIHKIYSGEPKNTDKKITIACWQSLYKLPEEYFKQYNVVIGDECHQYKANCIKGIMEKMTSCKYRFGFTGTLDGTQTNKLVIEGLFGKIRNVSKTSELIEKKQLSPVNIFSILLSYTDEIKEVTKRFSYEEEINFLCDNKKRNKFIVNLALSLKGNTLIMYQYIDKHGKLLYDMLLNNGKKEVYFISGEVKTEEREKIREIAEKNNDIIIIASKGTWAGGVNIKNLHNGINASPTKSRIRNLQSIGRGVRLSENKVEFNWYDIGDDLRCEWMYKEKVCKWVNHTYKHWVERLKLYKQEKLPVKFYQVLIK